MCLAIVTGGTISNDQIKVLIPTMKRLESLSYSRGQEAAADKVGVELALKAGYDPEAFSEFFLRLKDELGTDSSVAVLFSDHPMTQDRVNAIHKESEIQRKKLGLPTK